MSCRTISAPDDAPELDVFPELDGGPRLDPTGEEVSTRKASKQTNFRQEVLAATNVDGRWTLLDSADEEWDFLGMSPKTL